MNRPTHRCSAHLHAMLSFPPLAIVLLARIGVCFQQLLHSHLQGHSFLRRPPWNGPRQNGSCFASLLQIALDGRPRHLEEIHDLHSGDSFVNCAKHLLSQILWIGSHTPILSPGSIFLQALVHKLPLQRCAKALSLKGQATRITAAKNFSREEDTSLLSRNCHIQLLKHHRNIPIFNVLFLSLDRRLNRSQYAVGSPFKLRLL